MKIPLPFPNSEFNFFSRESVGGLKRSDIPTIGGLMLAIGSDAGYFNDVPITGVTADTRKLHQGSIFFAIPGGKTNGSHFINEAVEAGAVGIIGVEPRPQSLDRTIFYHEHEIEHIREAFSKASAYFYPSQPKTIVAVTGTAGKSSVVEFMRQIFNHCSHSSASIGTLGIITSDGIEDLGLTTPDASELHKNLQRLAHKGITHVAIEASSHGLDQYRLDGVRISAAAFTNLGRDHLDYHPDMGRYFAAKLLLFERVLPAKATAIINLDDGKGPEVAVAAAIRGTNVLTLGENGDTIKIKRISKEALGQHITFLYRNKEYNLHFPLVGRFQAENALLAALCAISVGEMPENVFNALQSLEKIPGRLEQVGLFNGAPIFVDYAHKPEALSHALDALRPYTRGKLVLVFGCGGERDKGKRPIMGKIAQEKADIVIITDDNPRFENPASIRSEILFAAPKGIEIADRAIAIRQAISGLSPGDLLLIAGKGHEKGQIIGTKTLPFSDKIVVETAIRVLS